MAMAFSVVMVGQGLWYQADAEDGTTLPAEVQAEIAQFQQAIQYVSAIQTAEIEQAVGELQSQVGDFLQEADRVAALTRNGQTQVGGGLGAGLVASGSGTGNCASGGGALDGATPEVIRRESGGDYCARNPSGACGAYQIMPGTWNGYGGYASACDAPPAVQDEKARSMPACSWQPPNYCS
jgi:Transglycosylase-like domain